MALDLSGLNPDQRAAVCATEGPLLVLAGAGSGKTRVITHRVVYLIERGVAPGNIVALSFTNKAADEMRERLMKMTTKAVADALVLGTFHSVGAAMMREQPDHFGVPKKFGILDQGDVYGLVRAVLRDLGIHGQGAERRFDLGAIVQRISLWKNDFVSPTDAQGLYFETEYDEAAAAVYGPYEERLRALGAVDFDDLICRIATTLEENAEARAYWQAKFRYLMVDEYQDTNRAQLEVVRRLAGERENVCVVGDDDQAIYGWRGAKVANILGFDMYFKRAQTIKLEQNYRSYAPICRCANAVIQRNTSRHEKELVPQRRGGDKVTLVVAPDGDQEARFIGRTIYREIKERGTRPEDIAVLYRSAKQCDAIEALLQEHGLPYRILGGQAFYDKKQVKDALAYLKVMLAPQDDLATRRALDVPSRGVGLKTIEHLSEFARHRNLSLAEAIHRSEEIADIPGRAAAGLRSFSAAIKRAQAHFYSSGSAVAPLQGLLEGVGLREYVLKEAGSEAAGTARWDGVVWLLEALGRFEQRARAKGGHARYNDFFQVMNATKEKDKDEGKEEDAARGQITLSTLHSAKGLEWPLVFLIGCEEGIMPHKRVSAPRISDAIAGDIEEERRLFYVGITRARDRLYITRAATRLERGAEVPRKPSRFLDDLPEADVQVHDIARDERLGHDNIASRAEAFLANLAKGL
ncbi:UvrD-helicase domain-containing protein [Nannocystis pusilla]|uniref:DNA 3'-5' helicase n=1 Tax=Nannocystis pusilla TaxID=889268 RepID=A0A9X3EVJ7_9BACT|nr:UvrD-helicase domain-containing protein [Nannocystis pusilla]MCY1011048.1 UvrD-helicase domain-containing protein [Nannocystis pusilla]